MAVTERGSWVKITPENGGPAKEVIIFGHGRRTSARVGGKIVTRPKDAVVNFYCPPNKILKMLPEEVRRRAPYYTARYRKIHEYVIGEAVTETGAFLDPGSLQQDADVTGYDIYTPKKGYNDCSLHALFCNELGGYEEIHCVFCRVGQRDRALIKAGKLDKSDFVYDPGK